MRHGPALLLLPALALVACSPRSKPAPRPTHETSESPAPRPLRGDSPAPTDCAEQVPLDASRFACRYDDDCVNTCEYGAVNRSWFSDAFRDCEDGCVGPEIMMDEPRCVDLVCTAVRHGGAPEPSCTHKPAERATICLSAEEVRTRNALIEGVRLSYQDVVPDRPGRSPASYLGLSRSEAVAALAEARFPLDLEYAGDTVVGIRVNFQAFLGSENLAAWRADHPGPRGLLTAEEAAGSAGFRARWPSRVAYEREADLRWATGDLTAPSVPPDWRLEATYATAQGRLHVWNPGRGP